MNKSRIRIFINSGSGKYKTPDCWLEENIKYVLKYKKHIIK